MRKTLFVVLVVVLALLPSFSAVAQPASIDDLTTLADHFPSDTVAFVALRTDQAHFTELDVLLNQLNANFGGDVLPPGFGSRDLFDLLLIDTFGLSSDILFDWLGDSAAIGFPTLEPMMTGTGDEFPVIVAAQVTDRAAAEDFMRLLAGTDLVETTTPEYTVFTDTAGTSTALVSDTVFVLGANYDVSAPLNEAESLSSNEAFQDVMDALPAQGYSIAAYVDATAINESMFAMMESQMEAMPEGQAAGMAEILTLSQANAANSGRVGLGLALTDGRTLVLDMVTVLADGSFRNLALMNPLLLMPAPLDPDFAAHIPGDAQFVVHNSNFGGQILNIFAALDQISPVIQSLLDALLASPEADLIVEDLLREADMTGMVTTEEALEFLRGVDLSTIRLGGIVEITLTRIFAGLTGLNLRDDVLEVMDGDYAIWARLIEISEDPGFTGDAGFATESTDDAATAYIVSRTGEALALYEIGHAIDEIAGANTLIMRPIQAMLQADAGPGVVLSDRPYLDLLLGANGDVLVFGLRPGAEFALSGDAAGSLQTNPVYNYAAQNLLLEDPNGVVFINIPSLMDALPALVEVAPVSDLQEIAVIGAVVESITMSSSINDDVSRVRLTLTVPQQPNVPQFTLAEPTVPLTRALPTRYDGLLQSLPAEGIAQLGPDNPAVTVQLFESFSCPHCANFDQAYMDELVNLVRNESVSLQYIPMLTGPVPNGDLATMGAYCAGEQDAFWPYHDLLFQWHREFGNEAFTVDRLESGVHDLGLDFDTFIACIQSGRGAGFLNAGGQLANAAGVTGTPTIIVNGEQISQNMMIAAIEDALP